MMFISCVYDKQVENNDGRKKYLAGSGYKVWTVYTYVCKRACIYRKRLIGEMQISCIE